MRLIDPIEQSARAAAHRLANQYGPELPAGVEAALHSRGTTQRPEQYVDPIAVSSLIVSVATLAWTVYNNLRAKTPQPSPEVVARTVRVRLSDTTGLDAAQRDRVIDVVVEETVRAIESE